MKSIHRLPAPAPALIKHVHRLQTTRASRQHDPDGSEQEHGGRGSAAPPLVPVACEYSSFVRYLVCTQGTVLYGTSPGAHATTIASPRLASPAWWALLWRHGPSVSAGMRSPGSGNRRLMQGVSVPSCVRSRRPTGARGRGSGGSRREGVSEQGGHHNDDVVDSSHTDGVCVRCLLCSEVCR